MADISAKFVVDGEQNFKSALQALNAQLGAMDAELKASADAIKNMGDESEKERARQELAAKSTELYTQKLEILQKQHDSATATLGKLGTELQNAERLYGKNSAEATRAATAYNKQQVTVAKLDKAISDTNRQMAETPGKIEKMTSAAKENTEAGGAWEKQLSQIAGIMKLNFAGAVIGGVVGGIKSVTDAMRGAVDAAFSMSRSAGTMADDLLTLSSQTGIAADSLQKWAYTSRFIDTSVDTITGSMTKMQKNMTSTSEATVEAFKKLGVATTTKNGGLRDTETVFFELIDALGKVKNETERDVLAMTLFGKSAKELNPLIQAGSQAFRAMGDEARNMGVVFEDSALNALGAFDDAMQRMEATSEGLKNTIGAQLVPVFQPFVDAASKSMGEVSVLLKDGLQPGDIQQMVAKLKTTFADAFRSFGETAKQAAPVVLSALRDLVNEMAEFIRTDFPAIAQEVGAFFQSLSEIVSPLLEPVGQAIMQNLGGALSAAIAAIDWPGIALALIQGLLNGIAGMAQMLWDGMNQLAESIANAIKDFFGIHSPSTLMEEIGGFIMQGLAQGLFGGLQSVLDTVGQVFGKIWEGIKSFFGGGRTEDNQEAVSTGAAIMQGMEQGINEGKAQMEAAAKTAATDAVTAINAVFGYADGASAVMLALGQAVDLSMASGIEATGEKLLGTVRSTMQTVYDAFTESIGGTDGDKYTTIGLNIDRGIARGILENTNLIIEAAQTAAQKAFDAAKDALGIASPSKVFRDRVGLMISKGMALGIMDGVGDVTAAVGAAADASLGAGGMIAGASGRGGFTFTQNVYANHTSYAAQQREAAQQFEDAARRLEVIG